MVSTETNRPRRDRDSEGRPPGFTAPAAKPARGGAGKPVAVAVGRKSLERRSPREQRSGRGDLLVAAIRTSGGSKTREPGEDGRGSTRPLEPTACGQDRAERSGPSLRRERLRRAEPHERARHETRPWRSREKQSAERAREPWGRNVPGEASPVSSGFPRSQALQGMQPHGRRRTREGGGSRLRSDSEGETRPGEFEASVPIVHWRQRAGERPRRPPVPGKAKEGARNP